MAVARDEMKNAGGFTTFFVIHFGKKKGKLSPFSPISRKQGFTPSF
jgi:hypothetical protein